MAKLPSDRAGLKAYIDSKKKSLTPEQYSKSKDVNKAVIRLKQFTPEKFDLEAGGGNLAQLQRGVEDPTLGGGGGEPAKPADVSSYLNSFQDSVFSAAGSPETREQISAQVMPDVERPDPFSRVEEFERLREEQGVAGLETSLTGLKEQKEALIAEDRARRFDAEGKPVALGVIGGRVSEIERQTNERIDAINRQINTATDQLNTSYGIIETYINLGGLDYTDAVNSYNTEFDQNLQIYKIVEEEMDEQQATARANLQTYQNAIIKGNLDYGSLSSDQKVFVSKLEVQSGLPIGFTSQLQADNAGGKVLSTTTRESAGQKFVDVVLQMPDGSMKVQTQSLGAAGGGVGGQADSAFRTALKNGREDLESGHSWGSVWDRISSQFPNVTNEQIDSGLGTEFREGGAYERFVEKTAKPTSQSATVKSDITKAKQALISAGDNSAENAKKVEEDENYRNFVLANHGN